MLFGLQTTDAATYTVVLIAVLPVILLAAFGPAAKAGRVDPMIALRNE
jgi:ABC-type lipoprotein release transport system permease subunit